jgi:hypothetical protein
MGGYLQRLAQSALQPATGLRSADALQRRIDHRLDFDRGTTGFDGAPAADPAASAEYPVDHDTHSNAAAVHGDPAIGRQRQAAAVAIDARSEADGSRASLSAHAPVTTTTARPNAAGVVQSAHAAAPNDEPRARPTQTTARQVRAGDRPRARSASAVVQAADTGPVAPSPPVRPTIRPAAKQARELAAPTAATTAFAAAGTDAVDSPADVHIHIGRVEITALAAAPPARPRDSSARKPMTLDDYLRQRRAARKPAP